MRKAIHILGVAGAMLTAAPACASVFDHGVYAARDARVSGGSYGRVAAGALVNDDGAGSSNVGAAVASTAALTAQARAFSADVAARASTGAFVGLFGVGTLTGASAGVNVFNLTAAQFNGLSTLTLAQLGTGAVINVSGTTISSSLRLVLDASLARNVLFNFKDATSVTFADADLGASILAPNALVRVTGGAVAGTVVSDRFDSIGATIGGRGFLALDIDRVTPVAAAVPEPSTWGVTILGLGLVGAAMRRRRAPAIRTAFA